MSSAPVTIDLGLDRAEPETDRAWPGGRWLRDLGPREWLVAASTALMVLPLGGAEVPDRVEPLGELTVRGWEVAGEHLLTWTDHMVQIWRAR